MTERSQGSCTSISRQGSSHVAPRQQRSKSLRTSPRGTDAAARAALESHWSKERRRSLHGVTGERRDEHYEENVRQRPVCPFFEEKHTPGSSGDDLRRTPATTSLLRSVKSSPAKICLALTSIVLLVALFVRLTALSNTRGGDNQPSLQAHKASVSTQATRCHTERCRRIGALLKDAMDSRARPCDDFHAYVCGSWSRKHPGQTFAQVHTLAFLSNITRRARNVRVPFPNISRHQTAVQKAAMFFVACDNIVASSEDQSEEVRTVLSQGGISWPSGVSESASKLHVLKAMFYMSYVVKVPVLLDVSMKRDSKQQVVIRRPSSANALFKSMKRHVEGTALGKYERYFRTVYETFTIRVHSTDVEARFRNIARLETAMVSFLAASKGASEYEKNDTWLTNTANVHHLTRTISKQSWLEAFHDFMAIPEERSVQVVLHNGVYLQRLFSLLEKLGETDFAELYSWLCVNALVPFSSGRIIAAQHGGSHDSALRTQRWHCFRSTDKVFHYALEHIYLSDLITDEVKEDVRKLMQGLSRSFTEVLRRRGSETLTNECAALFDESLAAAYTELFRHSRPEYFEGVYAHYPDMTLTAMTNWLRVMRSSNSPVMSYEGSGSTDTTMDINYSRAWSKPLEASYLDAPWYSLRVPSAVKFAGIGSRLLQRLISQLTSRKRVCQNAVLDLIDEIVSCTESAHGDRIQDFEAIKSDFQNAALSWKVLWAAFRASSDSKVNVAVLENIPHLSQSALFFVMGCLLTCGEAREVAEARCNMPLRHDENFADVFFCVWNSSMRPRNRCPGDGHPISL